MGELTRIVRRKNGVLSLVAIAAVAFLGLRNAAADEPKRVLLVHSFGTASPPFTVESTAFETELVGKMGDRVDLDEVSLDMARYPDREMQEAMRHHRSAQGLAHAARGMLAQEGAAIIDSLPTIRVPTLIILGDRDTPFIAPCEYMAKKIPGARLEVIKDAGHSSNLDQPEAFNRVLLDFLGSLP